VVLDIAVERLLDGPPEPLGELLVRRGDDDAPMAVLLDGHYPLQGIEAPGAVLLVLDELHQLHLVRQDIVARQGHDAAREVVPDLEACRADHLHRHRPGLDDLGTHVPALIPMHRLAALTDRYALAGLREVCIGSHDLLLVVGVVILSIACGCLHGVPPCCLQC
jgi:hypothetical protein